MSLDSIEIVLSKGGVIAYPTEAVWGLGCLPESEAAVQRILKLKDRSWVKGLILVASDIEQILPYVILTNAQKVEIEDSRLAAITYLMPKSKNAPSWITGKNHKIAIRISTHPAIRDICGRLNTSLVSTSANPSGKPPAVNQLMVDQYFPLGIDECYSGDIGTQRHVSEIRDLVTGEVVRGAA